MKIVYKIVEWDIYSVLFQTANNVNEEDEEFICLKNRMISAMIRLSHTYENVVFVVD